MSKFKGLGGGKNGGNEAYRYKGRVIKRVDAVKMVENDPNKFNDTSVIRVKGKKYLRDKQDKSKVDNINYNR